MQQEFRETGERPVFEPIAPGLALKMIFERNMHMPLEKVSMESGIGLSTLEQIAENKIPIDRETGERLIAAFGSTGVTLVRLQSLYDYFQKNRDLPRFEDVY